MSWLMTFVMFNPLVRIAVTLLLVSSSFSAGVITATGFGFVPIFTQVQIFSVASVWLSFAAVILAMVRLIIGSGILMAMEAHAHRFAHVQLRAGITCYLPFPLHALGWICMIIVLWPDGTSFFDKEKIETSALYMSIASAAFGISCIVSVERRNITIGFFGCLLLGAAFTVGAAFVIRVSEMKPNVMIYQTDGAPLKARILFSSSNGVFLFPEGARKTEFYNWSQIKRIAPFEEIRERPAGVLLQEAHNTQ